jgi:hypothetical protein
MEIDCQRLDIQKKIDAVGIETNTINSFLSLQAAAAKYSHDLDVRCARLSPRFRSFFVFVLIILVVRI